MLIDIWDIHDLNPCQGPAFPSMFHGVQESVKVKDKVVPRNCP
jgi:hypothetical protein